MAKLAQNIVIVVDKVIAVTSMEFVWLLDKDQQINMYTEINMCTLLTNCPCYSTFVCLVASCTPTGVLSLQHAAINASKYTGRGFSPLHVLATYPLVSAALWL